MAICPDKGITLSRVASRPTWRGITRHLLQNVPQVGSQDRLVRTVACFDWTADDRAESAQAVTVRPGRNSRGDLGGPVLWRVVPRRAAVGDLQRGDVARAPVRRRGGEQRRRALEGPQQLGPLRAGREPRVVRLDPRDEPGGLAAERQ